MFILESNKSQLVETYMKGQQPEVNIIDVEFEEIYWNYIYHRITQFVDYLIILLKMINSKTKLLDRRS